MKQLAGALLAAALGAGTLLRAEEPAQPGAPDWVVISETMPEAAAPPEKPKPPVGVGLVLSTKPGERGVVGLVVRNSPAAQVGLEPGVRVLAVNGKPVGDLSSPQIAALMQGKAGGKVKLKVYLPKIQTETTYDLERVELPLPLAWTTGPDDKVYNRDLVKPDESPYLNTPESVIDRLRKP